MRTYFAVLNAGITINKAKKKLEASGMKILRDYPELGIVKFETEKKISELDFDFLLSIEEEKKDFDVQGFP